MDDHLENYLKQFCKRKPFRFMNRIKKENEGLNFIIGFLFVRQDKIVYAGDLAMETNVSTARVAAAINKLVRLGYVERKKSKKDARKTEIKLTYKGLEKAQLMHEKFYDFIGKIIAKMGTEKFEQFIQLSNEINDCAVEIIQGEEEHV